MAASVPVNVFGEPITDATVRKYFPDKKEITRKDRAYFAYNLKEADKKYDKSQEYVLQQSKEWHGQDAATLITIYNATGDTLTYYTHHDFHGHIETPHKYTQEIQNGQWAAFLHVGSHAAVVYSGRNNNGQEIAWLHSWYNEASDNRKFHTHLKRLSSNSRLELQVLRYDYLDKDETRVEAHTSFKDAGSNQFYADSKANAHIL
ncbi:hypothetical protein FEM48_Zijuj03G0001000 [Ziziphus jujuba var. spinosa]|uniref:23 kDa jasmonate-induced protein-like n=1 Tax=Ziziphus jujuba var. spinosa TaxID=714518 RepID=A0A978VM15_ZIZJJ|nr:hypothetical protein FEM48_Zijuj03G0001000 [Ziziphus jujuba var. spinosa]